MYEDKDSKVVRAVRACGSETPGQGGVVERLSKYGMQVMPSAFQRRTKRTETDNSATVHKAPERPSITTAMRKTYLKELSISKSQSVLSSQTEGSSQDACWALYQMEHAWMRSAVEGNCDTLLEFLSEDPNLLTRKDFISGYTVLHWLAKKGQDETLLKLLRYAQTSELDVNVNVRGSGGFTPLHLASMHGQYMVIKLLVGAFGADVDAMDYNGKRAWQYLKGDAPKEMKELLGAWDEDPSFKCTNNNNSTEIFEPTIWDQVDCDARQGSHFERTRNGWGLGSFRKLLQSYTLVGKNAGS